MRTLILLLLSFASFAQLPETGSLSIKGAAGAGRSISQQVDGNETGNKSLSTLSTTAGKAAPHSMLEFRGYPPTTPPDGLPSCGAVNEYPNGVAVNWTLPTTGEAVENIWIFPAPETPAGFNDIVVFTPSTLTFTINSSYFTSGNPYAFDVFACNDSDNDGVYDECSPACRTNTITYEPILAPPTAPTSVTAAYASGNINLTWSGATGTIDSYDIQRIVDAGQPTFLANDVASPYADLGPAWGSTYQYQVRAVNAGGSSPYTASNVVDMSAPPGSPAPFHTIRSDNPGGMYVEWTQPSTTVVFVNYRLEVSRNDEPYTFVTNLFGVTQSGYSYPDSEMAGDPAGTIYKFRVRSENGAGASAYAESATATY